MYINQETKFVGPYDYIEHLKNLSLDDLLQTKINKNIFSKDEYNAQKNLLFRDVFSKEINLENQTKFFNIYNKLCTELNYKYPAINFVEPQIKEYQNNRDILFKMFSKEILEKIDEVKKQNEIKYYKIKNKLSKVNQDTLNEKNNVSSLSLSIFGDTLDSGQKDLFEDNIDISQMSQKSNLKTYIIMAAAIAGLLTGVILATSGILIPLGIGAVQIALNCLVGVLSGATLGAVSTIAFKP